MDASTLSLLNCEDAARLCCKGRTKRTGSVLGKLIEYVELFEPAVVYLENVLGYLD